MKKLRKVTVDVALGLLFLVGFVSLLILGLFTFSLVLYICEKGDPGQGAILIFFRTHRGILFTAGFLSPLSLLGLTQRVRKNVLWWLLDEACRHF